MDWKPAKQRECDKALECLRLTKGDAVCPDQGKMCGLYDEIGGGAAERALFPDWRNKGEVQR